MGDYYLENTVTLPGQNGSRFKSLSQIKRSPPEKEGDTTPVSAESAY